MQPSSFHFLPPFFLLLLLLVGVVIAVLQVGILGYAYEKIGISRGAAYAILLASLLGSGVNIPVAELPGEQTVATRVVVDPWFGTRHLVPVVKKWPDTVVAVNLGGAIIPTVLSIYLIVKNQIYLRAALGIFAVTAVVHAIAQPVPQMGIAVPIFIPPIASALVAVLLSRDHAAPLAYVSGCLGTLIGADLLNFNMLGALGASVASIGGAGTFDGVFLTGILAVLLAGSPRVSSDSRSNDVNPPYDPAPLRDY